MIVFLLILNQVYAQSYTSQGTDWTDTCASGSNQSPINVQVATGTCDNSMVLDIQFVKTSMSVKMERGDSTISSTGAISSLYATDINGDLFGYTATRFEFHSPSEHTKEGVRYDMEMQIYHDIKAEFASTTYTQAVVSIFFQNNGNAQPFFETYSFSLLSSSASNSTTSTTNTTNTTNTTGSSSTTISINFNDLLGAQLDSSPAYYTYQGSLTVPPCTENVNWYVIDQVLPITSAQLTTFQSFYSSNTTFAGGNGNNRALMNSNDRTIKKGGVPCEEQFVYFFSFFILYIFINYFIFKLL